jgi:lipoprotein-anchoring transpeptidase ErfK/SrfK
VASGQLAVRYTPPVTNGGSPITGYEVTVDGGTTWWPCVGTSGTCTLTNLANGSRYAVALRAVNAVGPGAVSIPDSGVPTAPDPDKPVKLPKPRVWTNASFNAASNGLGVDGARTKLGVGTLPKLTFSRAIPDKRVVETHLTVTAVREDGRVKKVKGAWGWVSDRSAVFRPKTWWPGNSTIMVTSTLDRAVMGKAGKKYVVGSKDLATTWTFKTARKLIAKVDGAKVNMRVWIDGQKVKTFPVSLGKDAWETRNGVKVISTQKEAQKVYRSESLGLGPEEYYELDAPWNTRLTPTGEFIHTASWAYGRIGRYNGSHGCTNMYEQDAKWIFDKTIPGDVVLYENTGGTTVQSWNGAGGLWNIPWDQWLKKSALGSGGKVDASDATSTSGGITQEASA